MLRQLRCLAGHSWETEDDAAAYCPRCGELADAISLFEETPPAPETPVDRVDQPTRDARGWPVVPGYELREKLVNGPLGVERYRARQLVADRLVIVEIVVAKDDPGQTAWGSLRGEARALGKLDHPNIVPLLAVGERERLLFYNVLPDDSGPTLAEWFGGRPLPWREVAQLGRVLALALRHAHERGVVHRALQPRFVRLCPAEGDGPGCVQLRGMWYRPRLEKFGLARTKIIEREPTDLEAQPEIPAYLSPEQALGHSRDIGPRSDIYALGILLAELLLGKSPLAAPTRMQTLDNVMRPFPILEPLRSRVPPDLFAVLETATSYRADGRYASVGDLAEDLANVSAGQPLRSRPARPLRWLAKTLWAYAAIWAFLLGGAVALLIVLIWRIGQPSEYELALQRSGSWRITQEDLRAAELEFRHASFRYRASIAKVGRLIEAGDLAAARAVLGGIEPEQGGWEHLYYANHLCGFKPRALSATPGGQPTALNWGRGELAIGRAVRSPDMKETGRLELWRGDPLSPVTQSFEWPVLALARGPIREELVILTSSLKEQRSRLYRRTLTDLMARPDEQLLTPARTGIAIGSSGIDSMIGLVTMTTDHKSGVWAKDRKWELQATDRVTGLLAEPRTLADGFIANNASKVIVRRPLIPMPRPSPAIPIGDLDAVTALAVSRDGTHLAAGGLLGGVRLWSVSTGSESLSDRWRPSTRSITSLAFTPDDDRLAVGTEDGRLVLYDMEQGVELVNTKLGEGAVTGLAFDPTGRKLAVIHGERVLLWE